MSHAPTCEPSPELVVVAARAAEYCAVLDVLQDWSALGLVGDLLLVNTDAGRAGDVRVPCAVLASGEITYGALQDVLAARTRTTAARAVVVSRVDGQISSVSGERALQLVELITNALPTVSVVRTHLIGMALPGQGAVPAADTLAWLGWHNVIVAPESAQNPTSGVSPIVHDPADPASTLQLVGCLCSIAGLWRDEPSAALDDLPVAPGQTLMLARTFTRHLSAQSIEVSLLERLSDVSSGYPVPMVDGSSAEIIDDELGAVTTMAEALRNKHAHVFAGERAQLRSAPRKAITVGELLSMFFSFLWQALRNAPRAFVDRVVHEVSRGTAAAVNHTVFGATDPAFKVVVNGIGPDGKPASWDEFEDALAQVDAKAEGRSDVVQHAPENLAPLWRDFVDGGMTLLDAGTRSPELPPQMKGSRRAIVINAARVAPDPVIGFEIGGEVAPYVNRTVIEPNDVAAARDVNSQLEQVRQKAPHVAGAAAKTQQELRAFFDERGRSYTGRFGQSLFNDLDRCRRELREYDDQLQRLQQATEADEEIYERQRKLANKLKLVLLVALVLGIGALVLGILGIVSLVVGASVAVVVLIAWFVTSLTLFFKGQSMLFALLHQRQRLGDEEAVLRENAAAARADLRRLGRAYRQYLDWSRAFGAFVTTPLGSPRSAAVNRVLIGSRFPRNHRFGVAAADGPVIDQAAARIRGDLFRVGWVSDAWQTFLADVPEMGPDGFRVADNRDLLFSDPAITRSSLLTEWSRAVVGREWDAATGTMRDNVGHLLRTTARDVLGTVLARVSTRDQAGSVVSIGLADFLGGLDQAPDDSGHLFQRGLFAASASGTEPWRVGHGVHRATSNDFGRTIVLTQFSRGFAAHDLQGSATHLPPSGDALGETGWQPSVDRPSM